MKKDITDAQILHRLDISLSEDENRHTNPVKFLDNNNNVLYSQPLTYNTDFYTERHDSLGKAHYSNGELYKFTDEFLKEKQDKPRRSSPNIKKCYFSR